MFGFTSTTNTDEGEAAAAELETYINDVEWRDIKAAIITSAGDTLTINAKKCVVCV